MKKSYLFLTFLSASLLLASCNNNGEVTKGSYTLTLDALGGTFSDKSSTKTINSVGSVTSINALEKPTRSETDEYSYTFDGWYDGKTESANKITYPYTLSKNMTFYAGWNATAKKTYNVTLDANGGTFSNNQTTYTISNTSKVRKNDIADLEPTNGNNIFLGWFFPQLLIMMKSLSLTLLIAISLFMLCGAAAMVIP